MNLFCLNNFFIQNKSVYTQFNDKYIRLNLNEIKVTKVSLIYSIDINSK